MTEQTHEADHLGPEGFLSEPGRWGEPFARAMARDLGVGELTQAHWRIIEHLRAHYLSYGTLPWDSHVCRQLDLDDDCIHRLFGGPVEAWKVAGLPDPGEEARTYMLNQEA
jgi:TusE/DsrC/DsvC family sulfur relay protein